MAAKNGAAAKKFLAENAKKPGVITLPSGLQYLVVEAAAVHRRSAATASRVHYHGTLLDGQVFDCARCSAVPATFWRWPG